MAYTLYFRGLRAAAASTAAMLTLLEPLTGTVLAAAVLGERLSPAGIAGALILAAAVLLSVRAHAQPPKPGPDGPAQPKNARLPRPWRSVRNT